MCIRDRLESAMNAGRDIAIGDFVFEFDDVFVDYEPELIMRVYEKLLEGNDIVAVRSRGKVKMCIRDRHNPMRSPVDFRKSIR